MRKMGGDRMAMTMEFKNENLKIKTQLILPDRFELFYSIP
jgi:hypothetical protein